ncbi:MAG: 16S rRNA (cytosine(1402)-N(4))-methyltransferase RsmH [Hyphomicrobiales bacterium]|nr:16S rRNA (cytosine(1402)-N(4))-methyltransferase RsmH [Hyphomicrobiales bacterium]
MSAGMHESVMVREVVEALNPVAGGVYVDATFGGGGHARAILKSTDCSLIGIDRDPDVIERGLSLFTDCEGRVQLVQGCFGDLCELLREHQVVQVDGVTFDIGVSGMQIDESERGFSFLRDGPLDMRMSKSGLSAADVVNRLGEEELARVIAVYGEEKRAKLIARAIITARMRRPLERTGELADVVCSVAKGREHHPATKTFQALRILVNDELGELERGLVAAEQILKPGGRLAVIAFHSLEDRIVKKFLQARCKKVSGSGVSRHRPAPVSAQESRAPSFRLLFSRPRRPGNDECARNRRSRSARFRAAERTSAAPFSSDASNIKVSA